MLFREVVNGRACLEVPAAVLACIVMFSRSFAFRILCSPGGAVASGLLTISSNGSDLTGHFPAIGVLVEPL